MNPFLNPITSIPFLKNFLFDPSRLKRYSPAKIKAHQDSALRKIITYSYTVPLYQKKFKEAKIHPNDIRGMQDYAKLPFITKQHLVDHFPDEIVPRDYNKGKAQIVSTGGSTGKPVSIYTDFSVLSGGIGASIRTLQNLQLNWRTSRIVQIGNYSTGKADIAAESVLYSKARSLSLLNNFIYMNAFDPIKDIINAVDEFKPDMILSYPATFQHLAFLKNKGYGKNINPTALVASASVLDQYTRDYVEDAFRCKIYNVYGSTESSSEAAIAFECSEGIWHVNHDYHYVQAVDENLEVVGDGERGHIVETRLFGKATPIVKYLGLDDWVSIISDYSCSCGLRTPIFKHGVEGRISGSVTLPDGRVFPAASFVSIHDALKKLNTKKVKQYQIVQRKLNEIDILLVIDEELRNSGPSLEQVFKEIKEIHQKKAGPAVTIKVKEVNNIKSDPGKPASLVISHVQPKKGHILVD